MQAKSFWYSPGMRREAFLVMFQNPRNMREAEGLIPVCVLGLLLPVIVFANLLIKDGLVIASTSDYWCYTALIFLSLSAAVAVGFARQSTQLSELVCLLAIGVFSLGFGGMLFLTLLNIFHDKPKLAELAAIGILYYAFISAKCGLNILAATQQFNDDNERIENAARETKIRAELQKEYDEKFDRAIIDMAAEYLQYIPPSYFNHSLSPELRDAVFNISKLKLTDLEKFTHESDRQIIFEEALHAVSMGAFSALGILTEATKQYLASPEGN